ncbi:DEAD/DEAH box helicase family protein [Staphylococcus pettenkoferi]|uniref:DEAD/DEAH box helicase family protein n=1 Tax=Staphylococcus pettenkoferi TaxID=170573 RepID=UPI002553EEBC|nr:DEAD/DEAH box helicase family protein [Staphylococcus pettenkoferi]MDK7284288.1 DEAD/DEAH box helicase family protein [Staphylococcus pettenkoferi]
MSKINFEDKNTKEISEKLFKRIIENNYRYQTLTLFTGFGKTAISIATAGLFAKRIKQDINVFIIATKTKIQDKSWEDTVEQYNRVSEYKINIMDIATHQGVLVAKKNDKLPKKEIKAKRPSRQKQLRFLKKWKKEMEEKPTIIIVDEVHLMKNPTAKTSKALMNLMENSITIGLTATPMPNGMLDDGVAYLIYNNYYKNQSDFRKQHIPPRMYDRYYKPDVYTIDYKIDPNRFYDLDLFKERITATTFVPDVEVNFEMPHQKLHTWAYDLSQKTINDIYDMSKSYKERRYDSYRQYLSDVRRAIGQDESHIENMKEIIKRSKDKQPLIFYETNAQLEAIEQGLNEIGMSYKRINGQPNSDKMGDINKDDPNQAIVIQYKAGGKSIEFPNSFVSIFYGLIYSWGDISQAMGRNLRRGMPENSYVNQYFLLATHPHDSHVYNVIERKEEFSEELLEELAESVSKESTK